MPKLSEQMPLMVAFHTRTASIYHSMQKRFAGKTDKRGRVIRPARLVPFTLAEFRAWLMDLLGGKQEGSTACRYCNTPLFADTVRIEHPDPVSRGGGLGFDNLVAACDSCNRMKGQLSAAEFLALRAELDRMLHDGRLAIAGYEDIIKRLKGQVAVFRKFQAGKPKKKESGLLVEEPEQMRLLSKRL